MNNLAIAACVTTGKEDGRLIVESGEAEKLNIVHKELDERMAGINTPEEAREFSKDTGANYYISGEAKENNRENLEHENDSYDRYNYHNSRNRDIGMDR